MFVLVLLKNLETLKGRIMQWAILQLAAEIELSSRYLHLHPQFLRLGKMDLHLGILVLEALRPHMKEQKGPQQARWLPDKYSNRHFFFHDPIHQCFNLKVN